MEDDSTHNVEQLTREAGELAALLRQYARAVDAWDSVAREVEAEAICGRVRWLVYYHLGLRIGMSSDDWVWLNGEDDPCFMERCGEHDLWAHGRFWCSLPEGRRQWTEPFAAYLRHSPAAPELSDYTVWFASRTTMLDLATVRQRIARGEVLNPPAPDHEDGWAFVFRMGEHT